MHTFARHNADGEIIAISQMEVVPEGVEFPLGVPAEGEQVTEIELGPKIKDIPLHDLRSGYRVDAAKRRLVRKPAGRARDGG
jgi:hypothetical protein